MSFLPSLNVHLHDYKHIHMVYMHDSASVHMYAAAKHQDSLLSTGLGPFFSLQSIYVAFCSFSFIRMLVFSCFFPVPFFLLYITKATFGFWKMSLFRHHKSSLLSLTLFLPLSWMWCSNIVFAHSRALDGESNIQLYMWMYVYVFSHADILRVWTACGLKWISSVGLTIVMRYTKRFSCVGKGPICTNIHLSTCTPLFLYQCV